MHRLLATVIALVLAATTGGLRATHAAEKDYGYAGRLGPKADRFTFAVWGDPQPSTANKRKQATVNPRLRETVKLTNRLEPAFVVTVGDVIHDYGTIENYRALVDLCSDLKPPLYMLMGNHDHVTRADNHPDNPYGKREFGNFLWAQKQVGAPELVNYSFDAGQWHFVCFSQPGGGIGGIERYYEEHPEYFEWLASDLEANKDRPTIFFTHHPALPVGRQHMRFYGPSPASNRKLVNILTRHGNVKLAFFGHVHNSVWSVPYISWRYKGAAWIIAPNAANIIRDAYFPQKLKSAWGTMMLTLDGEKIESIVFHTLAGEQFPIEIDAFREYDDTNEFHFVPDWDMPNNKSIVNGGFEQPLETGWFVNAFIEYPHPPTQRREVRKGDAPEGDRYLYLYTKGNTENTRGGGYFTAEVRQSLAFPKEAWPVLRFKARSFEKAFAVPEGVSAYVKIGGHKKQSWMPRFTLVYLLGEGFHRHATKGFPMGSKNMVLLSTPAAPGPWRDHALNVRADYEKTFGKKTPWSKLDIDNLTVSFGVFNCDNRKGGKTSEIGLGLDAIEWSTVDEGREPTDGFEEMEPPTKRKRKKK